MGQYYKFISLNSSKKNYPNKDKVNATMRTWDFDNGAKLMEFSYIGNKYMGTIEALINQQSGRLAGNPIIFAGDYADEEPYTYKGKEVNLYDLTSYVGLYITPENAPEPHHYRYLINETKKVFFDMDRVKPFDGDWKIHPLPILCCDGNGRGGGDMRSNHREIGAWKRNVVVTSDIRPDETEYREVYYNFKENR